MLLEPFLYLAPDVCGSERAVAHHAFETRAQVVGDVVGPFGQPVLVGLLLRTLVNSVRPSEHDVLLSFRSTLLIADVAAAHNAHVFDQEHELGSSQYQGYLFAFLGACWAAFAWLLGADEMIIPPLIAMAAGLVAEAGAYLAENPAFQSNETITKAGTFIQYSGLFVAGIVFFGMMVALMFMGGDVDCRTPGCRYE